MERGSRGRMVLVSCPAPCALLPSSLSHSAKPASTGRLVLPLPLLPLVPNLQVNNVNRDFAQDVEEVVALDVLRQQTFTTAKYFSPVAVRVCARNIYGRHLEGGGVEVLQATRAQNLVNCHAVAVVCVCQAGQGAAGWKLFFAIVVNFYDLISRRVSCNYMLPVYPHKVVNLRPYALVNSLHRAVGGLLL